MSARAALELLAQRAGDTARPWPEFAEHDCAACHHNLRPDAPRATRKPATAARSTWYTSLLPRATAVADLAFTDLDSEMSRPAPARERAFKQARLLVARLDAAASRIESQPIPRPEELLDRFVSLARGEAKRASGGWDERTQLYHALLAHANAWRDMNARAPREDALRQILRDLARELTSPRGRLAPAHFEPSSILRKLEFLERMGSN